MAPSKPKSADEAGIAPLYMSVFAIVVGIFPLIYTIYRILVNEPVPLWMILTIPFSLLFALMGYLSIRLRFEDETRQRIREEVNK